MPSQTIKVTNLGQYGYLPDVRPSDLPLNAFSYSRNWRFSEGGYASVTEGYSDAFQFAKLDTFGGDNAELTFMYPWFLSERNTLVYYDAQQKRMGFVENAEDIGSTSDYTISQSNANSRKMVFKDTEVVSLDSDEFTFTANDTVVMRFADSDLAIDFTTAGVQGASYQLYGLDSDTEFSSQIRTIGTAAARTDRNVTIVVSADFDTDDLILDNTYYLGAGQFFQHEDEATHRWSATDAFGIPIFVNNTEAPWVFNDTPIPSIQTLDNWPSGALCKTMIKFNAFLFAIGYENEGADVGARGNSRTIAISDVIVTPGTLPNWDFDNASSFAQLFDLSLYTDGDIVGAIAADNVLFIFSTTDTIAMTYDGEGQFAATRLPIGGGTLETRTVCSIPNGRFHIGNGRMYIEDGNTFQEIGEGRWTETWFDSVDTARLSEVQTIYDPSSHSVWIKTPTSNDSQDIWIYNLDNQTVAVLDDHQEIKYLVWSADGLPAENVQWASFEASDEWEEIQVSKWQDFPVTELGAFRNRLLSCGSDKFFVHDSGFTFNGRDIDAILQREDVPAQDDSYFTYTIERVIPWIEASENVITSVRVGGSQAHDKPVVWTPYKNWTSGVSSKLDFRKSTKWGAIGFRSMTPNTILTGYEVKVAPQNRR